MSRPQIRRLRAEDWAAYRDVRLRALADSPDAFGSTFASERSRADEEWRRRAANGSQSDQDLPLVLDDGEKLIGLAWGKVLPGEPDRAHLFQMWVAPEARGQGYGSALVGKVVEWVTSLGLDRIVLQVTEGDPPARHLYERAGFEPFGELQPLRPGSSLQCQPMQLWLTPTGQHR